MSSDFLSDRRRGAEEAFFARQNELLRIQLRGSGAPETREDLTAASGIADDAVLDVLLHHNIGREGAAALALVPMVAVAWADGDIGEDEETALLRAAEHAGLARDSAAYRLFAGWLKDEPSASLMERWEGYAHDLMAAMNPPTRRAFREDVLGRAQLIAEAAGGFLGIGSVSAAEQAVLSELKRTLDQGDGV